jgi:glucose repression regulatory protein TUP1
MSTVYNHRQINASSRLNELLDAIRVEFENVSQDTSMLKIQRDDFEHKSELPMSSVKAE